MLTRHSRPAAVGLDQIVDSRPQMNLETFVEYFLGVHNLWDAPVPPVGSLLTKQVSLTCLYSNKRFSVYLVLMAANAEFAPHNLKNTQRFEVYLSGDYAPFVNGLQYMWPDQCDPAFCWHGFKVKVEDTLGIKAGARGCSFLSFRRGPAELSQTTSGVERQDSPQAAEGSNFIPAAVAQRKSAGIAPEDGGSIPLDRPMNPQPAAFARAGRGTFSNPSAPAVSSAQSSVITCGLATAETDKSAPGVGSISTDAGPSAPTSAARMGRRVPQRSDGRCMPSTQSLGESGAVEILSAGQNHSAARDALDRDRVPSLNSSDRL